jgi:tight adherence protein B
MSMLFVFIFLSTLALILLTVGLGLKFWEAQHKKKLSGLLQTIAGASATPQAQVVMEDRSGPNALTLLLAKWSFTCKLDESLRRAGLDWSTGQTLLATVILAVSGALVGSQVRILAFTAPSMIAIAGLFAVLPYAYIRHRGQRRMSEFEKQFPEALDFLSRAMRSGHAFSAGLEMLSVESPAPLGPEFRKVYDEQNLGAPIDVALRNFAARVPLIDVKFFVSAVLLQKDVGGNLGEILRNLARIIRERFQLKGQIRATSAQGRITALILTILPLVTLGGLMVVAPGYLELLTKDEYGKYLIVAAVVGQVSGYFFMKKIVNIKI